MLKGLYTAYTGMLHEQNRMDVLTNNLANADTIGYKKEGATAQSFDTVLVSKIKDDSEVASLARRIGKANPGVKIGEGYTDFSQGGFQVTSNMLDFAIAGDGFFTIEYTNKQGETSLLYTRDGNFAITTDGYLVTQDGDYVLSDKGRIKLDPTKPIVVTPDGSISQEDKVVDKIKITDFEDYNYLEHFGENYYYPVDGATTKDAPRTQINQGYLEVSNVSIVSEMVQMIAVSRQYEANQKMIQTIDSSLEIAVNQLGKV